MCIGFLTSFSVPLLFVPRRTRVKHDRTEDVHYPWVLQFRVGLAVPSLRFAQGESRLLEEGEADGFAPAGAEITGDVEPHGVRNPVIPASATVTRSDSGFTPSPQAFNVSVIPAATIRKPSARMFRAAFRSL